MERALGVCYYPEHWPEEKWADDASLMAKNGIKWVRIGEFAWSRLEPVEGEFDFEWLDRAIDVLSSEGLKIILGTPSATPPRWMVDKYPDMLSRDESGAVRKFGSRRHYCFSHEAYKEAAANFAEVLATRYGTHPAIYAWQIDNEYGCHDTTLSYSDSAKSAFQTWLKERYQTVDVLNRHWGNVFWSMDYSGFEQIELPNQTVTEPNPAHVMAFRRFSSDQVVAFNQAQVDAIKRHSKAPVVHNYMGRITDFDHYELGQSLDIASWDSYPIGFLSDRLEPHANDKHDFLRQGDPDFQAFHHDLYRTVGKGRWWVMEQQPGPVNWAPYNPIPLRGMVRLWSWEAFAHGAEVVSYFRWRQAPFAQEQMHSGLLRPNSDPAQALSEVAQVAQELQAIPNAGTAKAKVALVFDYASCWAWDTQPQGADFDMFRLVFSIYRALRRVGLSIDIIPPNHDACDDYELIFAPGLMTISPELCATKAKCVFGPRTGTKTPELSIPDTLSIGISGWDLKITQSESMPPIEELPIEGGGHIRHWLDHIEGDFDPLWQLEDGEAVLVNHNNYFYLTGWLDETGADRMVREFCAKSDIECFDLPNGLRIRDGARHRFMFNYSTEAKSFAGLSIPPAGVIWTALPSTT